MSVLAQFAETGRQVAFKMLGKAIPAAQSYSVHNLSYGAETRQQLDLYLPFQWRDDVAVIFLHGGTWQTGDKSEYGFAAQAFARVGLPTAVINYRLYPQVKFPAFVDDVALALRWLQDEGASYGFAAKRWILVGHSAGAHIACLVSMDSQYAERAGCAADKIAGVVCLAGVYSMRPEKDALFADLFSACAGDGYRAMKPINFIGAGGVNNDDVNNGDVNSNKYRGVPLLMYHGRKDTMVACRSAERMFKSALLAGQPATLRVNEGYGHYQPLLDLLPWRKRHHALMKDIQSFIRMHVT